MPGSSSLQTFLTVVTDPPREILFYADDPNSYKQLLKVYNNYGIPMRFRITCTDRFKYTVSAHEGLIRPHHRIDVTVHHTDVTAKNIGVSDTVRVQLWSDEHGGPGGKNELKITLLASKPIEKAPLPEREKFHPIEADSASPGSLRQIPIQTQNRNGNNLMLTGISLIFAFVVLYLPIELEDYLPSFFPRPSLHQKYITCFMLGVFTVLLIQS